MPSVVFDPEIGVTKELLQKAFAQENIDARVFFNPLSSLPMFNDRIENIWAWDIPSRAINLPSYHDMLDNHFSLSRVVSVIKKLLGVNY